MSDHETDSHKGHIRNRHKIGCSLCILQSQLGMKINLLNYLDNFANSMSKCLRRSYDLDEELIMMLTLVNHFGSLGGFDNA